MNIPLDMLALACKQYRTNWLYVGLEVALRHRYESGLQYAIYKPFYTQQETKDWVLDKSKDYGGIIRPRGKHGLKYGYGTRIIAQ